MLNKPKTDFLQVRLPTIQIFGKLTFPLKEKEVKNIPYPVPIAFPFQDTYFQNK